MSLASLIATGTKVWLDGVEVLDRSFLAARRADVDLLAEAIEAGGRDAVSTGALRAAAELVDGPAIAGQGPG